MERRSEFFSLFRYWDWKVDLDFEMAWQNDFTKKFPVFPKIHAPLSHGKVLKCRQALSLAKVRKQESTSLKEYARVKDLCKLHNRTLFILCKRERKKFQKNYWQVSVLVVNWTCPVGQRQKHGTLKIKKFQKRYWQTAKGLIQYRQSKSQHHKKKGN